MEASSLFHMEKVERKDNRNFKWMCSDAWCVTNVKDLTNQQID